MPSIKIKYWNKYIPECSINNQPNKTIKVQIEGHDYYGKSLKGKHFEKLKIVVGKIIPLFVLSIALAPLSIPALYATGAYRKLGIWIREVHYSVKIKFIVNSLLSQSKSIKTSNELNDKNVLITGKLSVNLLQANPLGDIDYAPDYLVNLHSLDQEDSWKESKNSIMISVVLANVNNSSPLPNSLYLPLCYFEDKIDGEFIQFSYKDTNYKLQISQANLKEILKKNTTIAIQRDPLFGSWLGPQEFYNKENIRRRYKVKENEGELILHERASAKDLIPGRAACGLENAKWDNCFLNANSRCWEIPMGVTANHTYYFATAIDPKSLDIIIYDDRVVFYGHVSSKTMPLANQGLCRPEDMYIFWYDKKLKDCFDGTELPPLISSRIKSLIDNGQDLAELVEISLTLGILVIKWKPN